MGFFARIFGNRKRIATDPPELKELTERALADSRAKTAAHDAAWRLSEASWNMDMEKGVIIFDAPTDVRVTAPVQVIGTYDTSEGTWMWGWDNPSVAPPLAEHARRLEAYGQEHNISQLTSRGLRCPQEVCWILTALACLLCDAQGGYCAPADTTLVFVTFGEVKLQRETA